jgi:peptidyl-prolyl cis-trans isomerase C
MSRSVFLAAVFAGAVSAVGGAFAQGVTADDVVVARVNGAEVYRSDVVLLHSTLPQQYQRMPVDLLFDQLVESLVDRMVVANAARAAGYLEDVKVKRRIALSIEGILHEVFIVREISEGVTEEQLRLVYSETIAKQGGETEVHAPHILL